MKHWPILALLLWPNASHACAVCFSATDENRTAFLATTIALSLLPLGMIGGGLLWLRHKALHAPDDEADRNA